ncbi:MAG: hypothetical protein K4H23_04345 [Mollicutes bacterium PWAP]|nr:hypothetical protein [Mollicutes bacterium PWAP]
MKKRNKILNKLCLLPIFSSSIILVGCSDAHEFGNNKMRLHNEIDSNGNEKIYQTLGLKLDFSKKIYYSEAKEMIIKAMQSIYFLLKTKDGNTYITNKDWGSYDSLQDIVVPQLERISVKIIDTNGNEWHQDNAFDLKVSGVNNETQKMIDEYISDAFNLKKNGINLQYFKNTIKIK